jgi:hypothetical protein
LTCVVTGLQIGRILAGSHSTRRRALARPTIRVRWLGVCLSMSNGHYPSAAVAYQGVHFLIGYGVVLTAAFTLHHWTYGFLAVLLFALVKEFIIDIFGKEHDSFLSSLIDFAFYMIGAALAILVVLLTK